jgi:hypothetical protein
LLRFRFHRNADDSGWILYTRIPPAGWELIPLACRFSHTSSLTVSSSRRHGRRHCSVPRVQVCMSSMLSVHLRFAALSR